MKLIIKYSIEKDIENYLRTLYKFDFEKHGRVNIEEKLLVDFPPEFQKELKSANSETEARKIITEFIRGNFGSRTDLHERIIKDLERAWKTDGNKVIKKLEKLYGQLFPFEEITIYLVSNKRCPYNYKEKWIMVYAKAGTKTKLNILLHELNHFMFYYYVPGEKLGLNKKQYEALKESLTALTNLGEHGYPAHQELRAWLKKQKGTIPQILQNKEWMNLI